METVNGEKRTVAAFDFDGTLVARDTFLEFALFVAGWPRLLWAMALGSVAIAKWKLGLWPGGRAKEKLFGLLYAGMPYARFCQLGREFDRRIRGFERDDIAALLKSHIAKGDEVFIVSASMAEWIAPWAEGFGVDRSHVIGTVPEVSSDGVLTGRFSSPNCHGQEKVNRLLARLPERDRLIVYAYGDSDGDRQLLAFADVGRKV